MQPKTQKLLSDIEQAAEFILKHATAVSLDDYVANDFLRLSVERQFEIIGEAARRILLSDPPVAVEIADLPQIVSFRNLIAHGYDETTMLGCLQLSATNFPLCWSMSGDCLAGGSRQFPTLNFRTTHTASSSQEGTRRLRDST